LSRRDEQRAGWRAARTVALTLAAVYAGALLFSFLLMVAGKLSAALVDMWMS
jgi:hypothetical protein